MATLNLSPVFPVPQQEFTLHVNPTNGGVHFVVSVSSAPPGSKFRSDIDATGAPVQVHAARTPVVKITAEVSGAYTFAVQEHSQTLVPVGSPSSTTIHVMSRVEVPVAPNLPGDPLGRHQATLLVHVANDAVQKTTLATHGVNSPALINPTTPEAKLAVEDAAVLAAVAAMETTGAAIKTKLDDLIAAWTARIQAPSPAAPATANAGAFRLVEAGGRIIL